MNKPLPTHAPAGPKAHRANQSPQPSSDLGSPGAAPVTPPPGVSISTPAGVVPAVASPDGRSGALHGAPQCPPAGVAVCVWCLKFLTGTDEAARRGVPVQMECCPDCATRQSKPPTLTMLSDLGGQGPTPEQTVAEIASRITSLHEQAMFHVGELLEKQDENNWPDLSAIEPAFQPLIDTLQRTLVWAQGTQGHFTLAAIMKQRTLRSATGNNPKRLSSKLP